MKYGVFFTILILTYNNLAFAQEELIHIQYIEPVSCKTFIPPPSIYRDRHILQKISTGPLTLEFDDNVPDPIKNGVEIAVAIWNSLLKSDVNVTIQVGWEYYSKNIAGGHAKGFDPVLQNDVWYPKSLANALSGYDINGSLPEMRLVFNSNSEIKWFTDINGTPGAGEVDLITIALHEICHGLGWTGSFDYDEKTKKGSWGIEEESISYPMIFDKFVDNNIFQLIDLHEFNNPSLELGTQLTSNHIYFNGPETKAVYNTNKPLLYSPVAWAPGRSVYHLDEDSFQKGTLNSLMTPNFYPEEVVHTPGEIILASLKDMGWDINRTMEIFSPSEWSAWTVGATYNIKWSDTETGTVCISLVDENGNQQLIPI